VSHAPAARDAVRVVAIDDVTAFRSAIPGLAAITVDAVESGSGVNFLAGATEAETGAWWEARTDAVASGTITVFVALDGDRIVGSTLLERSTNANSPHRAEVGKVIVLRSHRRRGIGAALMAVAEERARADGRWLLLLDTVQGSAAESMYRALGWTAFGVVPNHALLPDGTPWPTTYFWKDLR
jgi:GNAT superfamily N-acetyltransferase